MDNVKFESNMFHPFIIFGISYECSNYQFGFTELKGCL